MATVKKPATLSFGFLTADGRQILASSGRKLSGLLADENKKRLKRDEGVDPSLHGRDKLIDLM